MLGEKRLKMLLLKNYFFFNKIIVDVRGAFSYIKSKVILRYEVEKNFMEICYYIIIIFINYLIRKVNVFVIYRL